MEFTQSDLAKFEKTAHMEGVSVGEVRAWQRGFRYTVQPLAWMNKEFQMSIAITTQTNGRSCEGSLYYSCSEKTTRGPKAKTAFPRSSCVYKACR